MDSQNLAHGKFVRTNTVVGICYAPEIENFFREVSDNSITEVALFGERPVEVYDPGRDLLENVGIDARNANMPLRPEQGRVNLNFLRMRGIGDAMGFGDPEGAVTKWAPESSDNRSQWLEYVVEHGFEEQDPPPPPGVSFQAEAKYSDKALKDVMRQVRSATQTIYQQFVSQVELEFKVEVPANE